MYDSTYPHRFLSGVRFHWTLLLAVGWLMGSWTGLGGDSIPIGSGLILALSLLVLMLTAFFAMRAGARWFGLQGGDWSVGPWGPSLPRPVDRLATSQRISLAFIAPGIYLLAGLLTLPYLMQAGGVEGILAAWDWWAWPMVAARFSLLSFMLAALQLLPLYPLSGAYLLHAICGSHQMTSRAAQLLALIALVNFWQEPLVLIFAVYFIAKAETERRRSTNHKPQVPLALPLASTVTIYN